MGTIEQRVEALDGVAVRAAPALLEVEDLHVQFSTSRGIVRAVEGLSFHIDPGEIVAIVGESGSGKSVSALSIMRLLPQHTARIPKGRVTFDGRDLLMLSEDQMRELRGREISMIFQEPMTSLNPILTIGLQITEPLTIHLGMTDAQARERAIELLGLVGIPDPSRRLEQYPHQFSGGMRQRVMIAIGLACNPKLIIADEPTTALDVTIQAQILELMKDLSRKLNIALIVITHNLGVVARYADRVIVMYASRLVEEGIADDVFHRPRHPYSMGLLRSVPRLDRPRGSKLETIEGLPPNAAAPPPGCRFAPRCPYKIAICETEPGLLRTDTGGLSRCHRHAEIAEGKIVWAAAGADTQHFAQKTGTPLLSVRNLTKHFEVRGGLRGANGTVRAVDGVSFDIMPGETLGLVGEFGLRQDHGRPAHSSSGGADRRRVDLRGPRPFGGRRCRDEGDPAQDPGDLPGPLFVAQSAHDGRPDHRRAAACLQARRRPQGRAGARVAAPRAGRPAPGNGGALSASIVGRAASARRHCARAGDGAVFHRLRRGRYRRSTCRSRGRSSTCWKTCSAGSASPICSSPTTSRSCATSRCEWS